MVTMMKPSTQTNPSCQQESDALPTKHMSKSKLEQLN